MRIVIKQRTQTGPEEGGNGARAVSIHQRVLTLAICTWLGNKPATLATLVFDYPHRPTTD